MTNSAPIVVFDFDLTLTRWDTADHFFRWLIRRTWWRLAMVCIALPALGPLLLIRRARKWPIRFAVWVATLGYHIEDLPYLAEQHIRSLPAGHASVLLPAGLERLQCHLDQGHRVVIATGCLDPLARALLTHAGFGNVPLVASTLRPFIGGLARDQHCFGRHKVRMLSERGFAPPWATAYTDHHVDLPILELSTACYLINPTPQSFARIKQVLSAEATILTWR